MKDGENKMSEVDPVNQLDIAQLNRTTESEEQHRIVIEDDGTRDKWTSCIHLMVITCTRWLKGDVQLIRKARVHR